jgi:hypothetical protein
MRLDEIVDTRDPVGVCVLVDPTHNSWTDVPIYADSVNPVPQMDNKQSRRWWHWKRDTK